jgi:hypothetical protein
LDEFCGVDIRFGGTDEGPPLAVLDATGNKKERILQYLFYLKNRPNINAYQLHFSLYTSFDLLNKKKNRNKNLNIFYY